MILTDSLQQTAVIGQCCMSNLSGCGGFTFRIEIVKSTQKRYKEIEKSFPGTCAAAAFHKSSISVNADQRKKSRRCAVLVLTHPLPVYDFE